MFLFECRYETAEMKLLSIMKQKNAVIGNRILRQELREEARKHIGDTGLLDHLLKHMSGKVVSDGKERFRRRHNSDGAMEYWIEDVELEEMRKSAGVADSGWVPPPGWKIGDGVCTCEGSFSMGCAVELVKLKEEINCLRRSAISPSLKAQKFSYFFTFFQHVNNKSRKV